MTDEAILDQAIQWRLRLRDDRPQDWDAFVGWLEEDPRHSDAYDRAAFAEDAADAAFAASASVLAANDDMPVTIPSPRRGRWLGIGAVAAALIGGVVAVPTLMQGDAAYVVETGPGEQRVVTLGDNHIVLNGGTRLGLKHGDDRYAELIDGEAHFTVEHDPDHPFALRVGQDEIRDVGTSFDVVRDAAGLRVAVAEGAVTFNPRSDAIQLAAGQELRRSRGAGPKVDAVAPEAVGGWRTGRLSYRDAPLADVGRDLGRALGTTVTFAPAVAARSFTGVIHIDPDRPAMLHRIGLLLDLDVRKDADRWTFVPRAGEAR
ncbi:FecR family protein [Flavisphingomonas formosensis]|uniref:FecR family protein n=1 Tax=Flavisphingomonas formosensis TaxID=861534 RepID=UPI0018DFCF66|nr:FecR domain-containing protein [Sphingomonas formosensis]